MYISVAVADETDRCASDSSQEQTDRRHPVHLFNRYFGYVTEGGEFSHPIRELQQPA